jgi:dTDP-glucose 4,6-dehydratase
MIVNILHGRSLPIYGDGRNIRDWLYVEDHCRGIDLILSNGRDGEVYNIGGRAEAENLKLVHLLCECADREVASRADLHASFPGCPVLQGGEATSLIKFVTDRPGHDRRYAIDSGKIERELGFKPTVSLAEGLRRTVGWYLGNVAWWQSVMDGRYQDWITTQYQRR